MRNRAALVVVCLVEFFFCRLHAKIFSVLPGLEKAVVSVVYCSLILVGGREGGNGWEGGDGNGGLVSGAPLSSMSLVYFSFRQTK